MMTTGVQLTGPIVPINAGNFLVYTGNPVPNLATLALMAGAVTGSQLYVTDQDEFYTFYSGTTYTASSPLIITGVGGQWFRRNRKYVISNFTFWCTGPSSSKKVFGLTPGQQALTGNIAIIPDIVLDISASLTSTNTPFDVVPDAQGNLWVTAFRNNPTAQILKLQVKDIVVSGSPTPSVVLTTTGSGTAAIWAIAFDKTNSIWGLVNSNTAGNTKIQKFSAYEYALTGAPTPAANYTQVTIGSSQSPIFDSFGNLWMACFAGGTTTPGVAMFLSSQLQTLGSAAITLPTVFWSGTNFVGPTGAAFGPDGGLWIVDYATGGATSSVKKFDPTAATGNPAPSITITSTALIGVNNISFDSSGNMWCVNADNGHIVMIAASDLTSSGAKTAVLNASQTVLSFLSTGIFPNNVQRSGLLPSGYPIAA